MQWDFSGSNSVCDGNRLLTPLHALALTHLHNRCSTDNSSAKIEDKPEDSGRSLTSAILKGGQYSFSLRVCTQTYCDIASHACTHTCPPNSRVNKYRRAQYLALNAPRSFCTPPSLNTAQKPKITALALGDLKTAAKLAFEKSDSEDKSIDDSK